MPNFIISLKRTIVPVIVGSIIAFLANLGIEIDEAALITVLNGVFISIYYIIFRIVESKWPGFAILLGSLKQPDYTGTKEPNGTE